MRLSECEIKYSSTNSPDSYKTTIIKDLTAPTFELGYDESAVKNQWIQSSVSEDDVVILVQKLEDEGSGVNRIVFTLGDKTITKTGTAPALTLKELTEDLGFTDGKSTIMAEAYDNLDNKSAVMKIDVNYDSIPPEISIAAENNNIWTDNSANAWIRTTDVKKTLINVTASDEESGILKLEFSIKDKSYVVEVNEETLLSDYPVSLEILQKKLNLQEGKNIVTARAFDKAGNLSPVSRITLFYDITPPSFNEEIVDSKVWTDQSGENG